MWWVRRSSRAPVRRSEPRISVHSWKGRFNAEPIFMRTPRSMDAYRCHLVVFLLRIIGVVPRQNPIRVQTGSYPRTRTLFREGFGPGKNLSAIAKSDQKMVHCSVRGHGEHFHPSFSLKFVES